jgi:hypothetical protein
MQRSVIAPNERIEFFMEVVFWVFPTRLAFQYRPVFNGYWSPFAW